MGADRERVRVFWSQVKAREARGEQVDVYSAYAAFVFDVPEKEVRPELRDKAKLQFYRDAYTIPAVPL